ncbi:hypothetical protein ACI2KD_07435 [Pseudomonas monteilii]
MSDREQIMPDHPLYLVARDAHRLYLEAKERGADCREVERLRQIYEAQMTAATLYHIHRGDTILARH